MFRTYGVHFQSFPLPPCYYHSRQWSPMHSTHTQATCQYLVDRYSSISDSPAASFGHGCYINFFANFDVASQWITTIWTAASSLRIVTGATHSPPISSLLSFQSILRLDMLCFDRWRLYDTPDVVVHHRHRVVPRHQQAPSYIVSIDVLTSPIPSHIDWHQW